MTPPQLQVCSGCLALLLVAAAARALLQEPVSFPGVDRDLASFCSARPSLSIELSPMVVHVKRNNSFNYKLYLFTGEHVFQTGQIVPRDNFRIHSFPVKFKTFGEFWPPGQVPTFLKSTGGAANDSAATQVSSTQFNVRSFFKLVPLEPSGAAAARPPTRRRARDDKQPARPAAPADAQGDSLPGDREHHLASEPSVNLNRHIQFDRDDQVSLLSAADQPGKHERDLAGEQNSAQPSADAAAASSFAGSNRLVLPVGAFSSFHVNVTYLARKDFDQAEPELVEIHIDPLEFQVKRVFLLQPAPNQSFYSSLGDDFGFLAHKLLRDPNTRLVSINQIYENWITRNFYTIVYIQRRLEPPAGGAPANATGDQPVVSDRLIFRGSSAVLLGAEQLEHQVKSSAFITEKNNLHYYLEFLANGKFYLGAVDWSKRPFRFINWQKFPRAKTTRTQFDNEELLLCPPAVCYSEQPVDELVAYGRLPLDEPADQTLVRSLTTSSAVANRAPARQRHQSETTKFYSTTATAFNVDDVELVDHSASAISRPSLERLIDAIRRDGANQLEIRLHLRDWLWTLGRRQEPAKPSDGARQTGEQKVSTTDALGARQTAEKSNQKTSISGSDQVGRFVYHFEWARRNELKANSDSYGFVLTGQEIDASYRVFNELYLISSNQLITINYTLANETVTSTQPIGDEFHGLSSSLLDPITGAFYDRNSNQLYFFKGDRYVGFDYATKKPLEDFQLPPTTITTTTTTTAALLSQQQQPLVMSLPVVGILGRQHQVDGVYHDLHTDFVYIFTGMKFYVFRADEFKDGAFHNELGLPPMFCINEQLLDGCQFDEAFPNPCRAGDGHDDERRPEFEGADELDHLTEEDEPSQAGKQHNATGHRQQNDYLTTAVRFNQTLDDLEHLEYNNISDTNFSREQQQKLRSIAARGGGFLDYLVENTLLNRGALAARGAVEPILSTTDMVIDRHQNSSSHERIVIYMLIAMVAITILVTVAMIIVIINWSRGVGGGGERSDDKKKKHPVDAEERGPGDEDEDLHGATMNNLNNVLQQYQNNLLGQTNQFHRPPHRNNGAWNHQHQFAPPPTARHLNNAYLGRQLIGDTLPPQPQPPPVNSVFVLPPVKQRHNKHATGAAASSSSSSTARRQRSNKIDSSAL